jgi:hypothetical protein
MRWLLRAAGFLVLLAGFQLFILTEFTDQYFAWTIQPFVDTANITLSYRTNNGALVRITGFEAVAASMNYTWKVTVPGTFTVVLTLGSDNNYNSTSVSVVLKSS